MYTPIDDRATTDERISKFIESKLSVSPWGTLKKTIADWRTSSIEQPKSASGGIYYEAIGWSRNSFSRTSYRKLAN